MVGMVSGWSWTNTSADLVAPLSVVSELVFILNFDASGAIAGLLKSAEVSLQPRPQRR